MCKNPLDFCIKLGKKLKNKYKNRKNKLATVLLIIVGCFFYGNYTQNLISSVNAGAIDQLEQESSLKLAQNVNLKDFKDESLFVGEIGREDIKINPLEAQIKDITKDHPIEEMAPFIAQYDKKVAALIVGIAKKESNWGIHSPSKNGQTCYNYWGYKGRGSNGVAMGYGCFASPQEAVEAIGGRISELVNQNIDTPAEMVVWKCGRSCVATGGQAAANKWIADVNVYYKRIAMLAS